MNCNILQNISSIFAESQGFQQVSDCCNEFVWSENWHILSIIPSGRYQTLEFHVFLVCPLYNTPRLTLQNAMAHIAPFTLRTLLYGDENLDIAANKRIVTETLRFIKDSKRFDQWLYDPVICWVHFILCSLYDCVCSSFIVNFSFCHHLIDIHLYKFFTCLGVNKICLNQTLVQHEKAPDASVIHYIAWWLKRAGRHIEVWW